MNYTPEQQKHLKEIEDEFDQEEKEIKEKYLSFRFVNYDGVEYKTLDSLHKSLSIGIAVCNFRPKYRRNMVRFGKEQALALTVKETTTCEKVRARAIRLVESYVVAENKAFRGRWV